MFEILLSEYKESLLESRILHGWSRRCGERSTASFAKSYINLSRRLHGPCNSGFALWLRRFCVIGELIEDDWGVQAILLVR
jgi:hypothetical protein